MTIAGEQADTTWLRVADVAALMGMSANTVRRWTDSGRIAAYRSPGGHRRYLAADVLALMPGAVEDGAGPAPGDFADLRRQTQDLRAVVRAGHDLATVLSEAPRDVPEQVARRLCELTDTPQIPTSPFAMGSSASRPMSVGRSKATESPVWPRLNR